MGIVFRQSLKNALATYLGFSIGAVNTLFLFTYFLSKEQYGLIGYVLSTATILTPLMAFGVHHTIIKFYSSYKREEDKNRFVFLILFLPLLIILPFGLLGKFFYTFIVQWLSSENKMLAPYISFIYYTSIAMAYFEVFYAWARIQLKSVTGNLIKEVFHRLGITLLLFGLYFGWIDFHQFVWCLLGVYILRTLLMVWVALKIRIPKFRWGLPSNFAQLFLYSFFVILSGSVASLMIDIDKFMLNQYLPISNIAIYNVAVFTATVIVIPYRAMYQIVSPLTAQFINSNNRKDLSSLYERSTINVYLVGMLVFLLIILNASQLYDLIPSKGYNQGLWVLILIGIVKLSDTLVGINNAILFNSPYYKNVLYFGLFLLLCMVGLNMYFIPLWGINGSAFATLLAFLFYNGLKLSFVYKKYHLHPFNREVIRISVMGIVLFMLGFFWDFPFTPIINILLKSLLIIVFTFLIAYKLQLSKEWIIIIDKGRRQFYKK